MSTRAKHLPHEGRPQRRKPPLAREEEVRRIHAILGAIQARGLRAGEDRGWDAREDLTRAFNALSWRAGLVELGVWTAREAVEDVPKDVLIKEAVVSALRSFLTFKIEKWPR